MLFVTIGRRQGGRRALQERAVGEEDRDARRVCGGVGESEGNAGRQLERRRGM